MMRVAQAPNFAESSSVFWCRLRRMTQGSLTSLQNKYRNALSQAEQQAKAADAELRESKVLQVPVVADTG